MSISVLLVDDQPLLRQGTRMILEAEGDIVVVGEADNGHEAVVLAESRSPDVVLMDIRMPVVDGVKRPGGSSRPMTRFGFWPSPPSTSTSMPSGHSAPAPAASC